MFNMYTIHLTTTFLITTAFLAQTALCSKKLQFFPTTACKYPTKSKVFEYDLGECRTLSADEYGVLFLPQKWHLETGGLKPMVVYLFDCL